MAESRLIRGSAIENLAFDTVRGQLADRARTTYGRDLCEKLLPTGDLETAEKWQRETRDAFFCYTKKGAWPLSAMRDISSWISYAKADGVLKPGALLQVGSFLRGAEDLLRFGKTEDHALEKNHVVLLCEQVQTDDFLAKEIDRCILSDDEVSERASDELFSICRKIKDKQNNIRIVLDRILRNHPDALQDQLITIRSDRYVVPVRSERRSEVPGIIHDLSSSGQTVFIEPMGVVEMNNEIRELTLMKNAEIERILHWLSNMVRDIAPALTEDIALVAELDFLMAKALLAYDMEASEPILNNTGVIELRRARHPLIDKEKVVPIDFSVGKDYRTLVITGPNTGGKTVSLKTCGLLCLMAMAGLQIPCLDHSHVSVFDKVLSDIGDEQSIEQSLSTFSAHMKNLIKILGEAGDGSLVLVDELGSGTDPSEGAALAMSILEQLRELGAVTVATTHYKELKSYAVETQGVENACCEFDTQTLSPTYRLLIGMPGVSNAFQISMKLGLSTDIIERAKSYLSKDGIRVEELLSLAEKTNRESEKNKAEIRRIRTYVKNQEAFIEKERARLDESREKILEQAAREKKQILEEAADEVEEMIETVKKAMEEESKEAALSELYRIRSNLRAGLTDLSAPTTKEVEKKAWGIKAKEIVWGKRYEVPSKGFAGIVVKGPDSKGRYTMENGSIRIQIPGDEIHEPAVKTSSTGSTPATGAPGRKKRQAPGTPKSYEAIKMEKAANFYPELKLLGMTTDEAVLKLEQFLDDCILSNISSIRVVHGKGTGALRAAVTQHLRRDKRIRSFRLGSFGEGGDGVTIVEV